MLANHSTRQLEIHKMAHLQREELVLLRLLGSGRFGVISGGRVHLGVRVIRRKGRRLGECVGVDGIDQLSAMEKQDMPTA